MCALMSASEMTELESRAWLRQQGRVGRRASRRAVATGLAGTALGIGQAFCAAAILGAALTQTSGSVLPYLAGFAGLGLLRAVIVAAGERVSFESGAAARRRLRSDALTRLLQAGPSQLRAAHSGELAALGSIASRRWTASSADGFRPRR